MARAWPHWVTCCRLCCTRSTLHPPVGSQRSGHGLTHPGIDSRWSSERIEFLHHGLEATRSDKVRRIAASDAALRTLLYLLLARRGITRSIAVDVRSAYERCSRSAAAACWSARHASPRASIQQFITQLRLKPGELTFWEDNLRLAGEPAAKSRLVEAVRWTIEGYRWRRSGIGQVEAAVRGAFSRIGSPQLA